MFDETDFKHTQWTLDSCVADESLTFIQEIQENFFEPLIGKKQKTKQTLLQSLLQSHTYIQRRFGSDASVWRKIQRVTL